MRIRYPARKLPHIARHDHFAGPAQRRRNSQGWLFKQAPSMR